MTVTNLTEPPAAFAVSPNNMDVIIRIPSKIRETLESIDLLGLVYFFAMNIMIQLLINLYLFTVKLRSSLLAF
ncbi:hypothetical protein AWM70_12720 [Paenibacillus yonginensis]|uniref:Uncharacterized protein n=1 Tax=Paenibacillus yonginensis TaxID=1462996 RepID=A0A1B1N1S5_9BACL|nr:hypothetical protein AWM70_12720 [Paenibacillus yonginensis]